MFKGTLLNLKKGCWVIMPSCYEIMNLLYQIATDYNLTKHGNNM